MAVGTKLAEVNEAVRPDTEITLGTGKLLGIFFVAAIVCALFFGLGFNLGRASAPQADPNVVAAVPASTTSGVAKPSASRAAAVPCPAGQICSDATNPSADAPAAPPITEGTEAAAALSADANAKPAAAVSSPGTESGPSASQPRRDGANPVSTPGATAPPAGSFAVQVAAVSHKEDADALMAALRKKSYPAFVVSDAPDKLFHVQVGPFSDRKDAVEMRDKLSGDGYNPIIK